MRSKWDQRIQRAEELARELPFATEVLKFYAQVARLQKELYHRLEQTALPQATDKWLPDFLKGVVRVAPEPLAASAHELLKCSGRQGLEFLSSLGTGEPTSESELLAALYLAPFTEYHADHSDRPPVSADADRCPFCSRPPVAGILRQEGDGGKRSLLCGQCATEWTIGRMICPACGEQNSERLPVYTAEQFPHVRVEACETCHAYIKTIDLTKNGRAVPPVDELATIPLNLWAEERGLVKLRKNLLGM